MKDDNKLNMESPFYSFYEIKKGDSLYKISKEYNVNTKLLAELNGLNLDDYIYPGQTILIPKRDVSYYITKDGDTLSTVADKFKRSISELTSMNGTIYLLPGQLMINKTK